MKVAEQRHQKEDRNAFAVVCGAHGSVMEPDFQMAKAGGRNRASTGLLTVGGDVLSYLSTFLTWEKVELQREWKAPGYHFEVCSCHVSPCGTMILTTSGHDLHLWCAASGLLKSTLKGHTSIVTSCRFFPDGKTIVSASHDATLKVWDAKLGSLVKTLVGHTAAVMCVSVSPDNERVLSGSGDGTWKLWNCRTGELRHNAHQNMAAFCCSFCPHGKFFLVGCGCYLELHGSTNHQLQRTFHGHESMINSCCFTSDGKTILSGSSDHRMKLWSAANGQCLRTLYGHFGSVTCCSFSPSGHEIISASEDATLMMWTAATGQLKRIIDSNPSPDHVLTGDDEGYGILSACISSDGKYFVSGHRDIDDDSGGILKMWRMKFD
jgi:WD40 repeat protein